MTTFGFAMPHSSLRRMTHGNNSCKEKRSLSWKTGLRNFAWDCGILLLSLKDDDLTFLFLQPLWHFCPKGRGKIHIFNSEDVKHKWALLTKDLISRLLAREWKCVICAICVIHLPVTSFCHLSWICLHRCKVNQRMVHSEFFANIAIKEI